MAGRTGTQMSYMPFDRDILSSSLWARGTSDQIKVWFYLLLAADPRTGTVEDADPGIALRCGLPLDVVVAALDWLAAPDPHSRTKDHEGRRIERLPEGGLRILNYIKHRDKDYSTPRWRKWRERKRTASAPTLANDVGQRSNAVANDVQEQGQEQKEQQQRPQQRRSEGNGHGRGWDAAAAVARADLRKQISNSTPRLEGESAEEHCARISARMEQMAETATVGEILASSAPGIAVAENGAACR